MEPTEYKVAEAAKKVRRENLERQLQLASRREDVLERNVNLHQAQAIWSDTQKSNSVE
jgi:hypothetical protein